MIAAFYASSNEFSDQKAVGVAKRLLATPSNASPINQMLTDLGKVGLT